jgi:hypothetical protein
MSIDTTVPTSPTPGIHSASPSHKKMTNQTNRSTTTTSTEHQMKLINYLRTFKLNTYQYSKSGKVRTRRVVVFNLDDVVDALKRLPSYIEDQADSDSAELFWADSDDADDYNARAERLPSYMEDQADSDDFHWIDNHDSDHGDDFLPRMTRETADMSVEEFDEYFDQHSFYPEPPEPKLTTKELELLYYEVLEMIEGTYPAHSSRA